MCFFSSPPLPSPPLSCLFYIRVCSSLQAEANQSKTFELQNENFKLDQELEESDPEFYECGAKGRAVERGRSNPETEREEQFLETCIDSVSCIAYEKNSRNSFHFSCDGMSDCAMYRGNNVG